MKPVCDDGCRARAVRDLKLAKSHGLAAEVLYGYRAARRHGECLCSAMWGACYDWDI